MLNLNDVLAPENLQKCYHFYRNDMTHWSRTVDNAAFRGQPLFHILQLVKDLNARNYQVEPIRRVNIPKSSGGVRRIAELALRDKFIQRAFMQIFSAKIDGVFHKHSFAFRSGRNCDMALSLVNKRLTEGFGFIIHVDIKNCFDHIPLKSLSKLLRDFIGDRSLRWLLDHWLYAHATRPAWLPVRAKGIPQGSVLAPVFCNLYLHQLDQRLEGKGILFCRYGDDILVQCKNEKSMKNSLAFLNKSVAQLDLQLNNDKFYAGRCKSNHIFLGQKLQPCA